MKNAVVITGIPAIDKRLRMLPIKVQKKVLRQSMRAGLKVMATEVRNQAPVLSGKTRAGVKVRALRKKRRSSIALEVRIFGLQSDTIKTSAAGQPAFWPALEEFGDRNHPPNPFMRRSFEAKGQTSLTITTDAILAGVKKEATP